MIENLILDRMQRLMFLGLEGQPGRDVIEGTARMWVECLRRYSPERLSWAFDQIEKRKALRRDGGGWPAIGDIVAAMPVYLESKPLPAAKQIPADPEAAERIKAEAKIAIDEAVRKFGKRQAAPSDEARIEAERERVRAELARREGQP